MKIDVKITPEQMAKETISVIGNVLLALQCDGLKDGGVDALHKAVADSYRHFAKGLDLQYKDFRERVFTLLKKVQDEGLSHECAMEGYIEKYGCEDCKANVEAEVDAMIGEIRQSKDPTPRCQVMVMGDADKERCGIALPCSLHGTSKD